MRAVINFEETIGKTVGKRLAPNPLSVRSSSKESKRAWQKALGGGGVRRGVFRFETHKEADAWLLSELTRPKMNLPVN
jgi:hypothetical protein